MCSRDDHPPYDPVVIAQDDADDRTAERVEGHVARAAFLESTRGVRLEHAADLVYARLASIGQCGYPAAMPGTITGVPGEWPWPSRHGTCHCGQRVYFDTLAPEGGEWRHNPGRCPVRGHSQLGCNGVGNGDADLCAALFRDGVGISSVPGPTASELDREVMASEFHGRHPRAG